MWVNLSELTLLFISNNMPTILYTEHQLYAKHFPKQFTFFILFYNFSNLIGY